MSDIHVSRNGSRFGPYEEAYARSLFASGNIAATDLVWRQGMPTWRPATEIFGDVPVRSGVNLSAHAGVASASGSDPSFAAPPSLHWLLLLVLCIFSAGIFFLVWMFVQSQWVRKIDRSSRASEWFAAYLVLAIAGELLPRAMHGNGGLALGGLATIAACVVFLVGAYSMRRSMVDHFTTVEPISLRMSRAMIFFFSILYFQYHMSRIARWKKTGEIKPQS